jgi:hypothetical protein
MANGSLVGSLCHSYSRLSASRPARSAPYRLATRPSAMSVPAETRDDMGAKRPAMLSQKVVGGPLADCLATSVWGAPTKLRWARSRQFSALQVKQGSQTSTRAFVVAAPAHQDRSGWSTWLEQIAAVMTCWSLSRPGMNPAGTAARIRIARSITRQPSYLKSRPARRWALGAELTPIARLMRAVN